MTMRRTKASDAEDAEQIVERDILAAAITRTEYIESVKPFWRSDLFPTKWTRLVAKWCLDYFDKYGRAPRGDIEPWFEDRREQLRELAWKVP